MAQKPPLSLTAELEKLEQSITLTLQEIDHNFSKTHRIVTTSIIPIVERYAKESEAVWEGSKFWKQFFEASANVALSNYQEEEPTYDDPTTTVLEGQTYVTHDSSAFPNSSPGNYEDRTRRTEAEIDEDEETRHTIPEGDEEGHGGSDDDDYLLDDSLLDSLNITGAALQSTPKAKQKSKEDGGQTAKWADIESPFEALKKELTTKDYTAHGFLPQDYQARADDSDSEVFLPSTPPTNRPRNRRPAPGADPETPESSPFFPPQTTGRKTPGNPHEDALLHRVLDKNWRVQATPLGKAPTSKYRTGIATTPKSTRRLFTAPDSASPMSSPPKPHLQTQHIFSSPPRQASLNLGPKTPTTTKGKGKYDADSWDEDDDDSLLGYSPPQTIQFSFPQSKLLATPAREASRRIVKDILMTAGAADESAQSGDSSPPVVSGRGGSRWGQEDDDDDMIF